MEAIAIPVGFGAAYLVAAVTLRLGLVRPAPQDKRLGSIDGLRGYLALAVMVHHFALVVDTLQKGRWEPSLEGFFENMGKAPVILFFMITGALFYGRVERGLAGVDWQRLFVSRAFRLAPLMWAVVAAVGVLVTATNLLGRNVTLAEAAIPLARLALFSGAPPVAGNEVAWALIVGPTWTLRYEMAFYLSLPILAGLFTILGRWASRRVILALAIFAILAPFAADRHEIPVLLRFAPLFLLGMLAVEITRVPEIARSLQAPPAAVAGLIALVAELALFSHSFDSVQYVLLATFFAPVVAGNTFFGLLSRPTSVALGEASYSIYLLHGAVLFTFLRLSPVGANHAWLALPMLMALVVVVGFTAFATIERPGMAAGRWFADRLPRLLPAPPSIRRAAPEGPSR